MLVLNNRDLNQVTWEQRAMEGDPKFEASQSIPDLRYADYARLVDLAGTRVEDPEQVGAAWDEALASDRPFVLDAVTDPDVPPLCARSLEDATPRLEPLNRQLEIRIREARTGFSRARALVVVVVRGPRGLDEAIQFTG